MYLVVCQIEFEIEIISKKHYKSYMSLYARSYFLYFVILFFFIIIIRQCDNSRLLYIVEKEIE